MEKKDDGGNAFPQPGVYDGARNEVNPVGAYYDAGGMSLRDAIAIAAMQGLLANSYQGNGTSAPLSEANAEEISVMAWRQADAMLEARKK